MCKFLWEWLVKKFLTVVVLLNKPKAMKKILQFSVIVLMIGCTHKPSPAELKQLRAETAVKNYLNSKSDKKFENLHFTRLRMRDKTDYEIGVFDFIPEKYKIVNRTAYFVVDSSFTKVEPGLTY